MSNVRSLHVSKQVNVRGGERENGRTGERENGRTGHFDEGHFEKITTHSADAVKGVASPRTRSRAWPTVLMPNAGVNGDD
jgi:hypothetical protein